MGTKQIQAGDEWDFKRDKEVQSHVQLSTAQVQLSQELDLQREQVPSNFIVGHNPVQFSQGMESFRGQSGPTNFSLSHNPIQFSHGLVGPTCITMDTIQPKCDKELDLMSHNVPLELGNQTRHHLGAVPKGTTPRERLSTSSEELSYSNMGDDPRPAQHKILQQCLRSNPKHVARDPNEVAMV